MSQEERNKLLFDSRKMEHKGKRYNSTYSTKEVEDKNKKLYNVYLKQMIREQGSA